ncbi:MAG TPA: arginase family protein [Solirubrobacterales bacterium]|nr:arginase family protein [Solirubrobacterales bacterium]
MWQLTGVPYTSMRKPGGIANAITVLRQRNLAERLGSLGVEDAGDLKLDPPTAERGPSGILNEPALVRLVEATRERVSEANKRGRLPLLVGGDCPVLLGALAAARDTGEPPGLIMLDGHEDAWPPSRSETGEGSDSEIAIALGSVPSLPSALDQHLPLLDLSVLAYLGPRDRDEILAAGVESLRDRAAFFADAAQTSEALASGRDPATAAVESIAADAYWLHIDLDVLASHAFDAVDYPQPGGLDWEELDQLAAIAACEPRCRGVSVVIYNPDLDPSRAGADKLVAFLSRLIS